MFKIAMALVGVLAVTGASLAQTATPAPMTYNDAVKACGADWKAFKGSHAKVGGRDQWQVFRADCVTKKGYTSNRTNKIADRMSNDEFKALLAGGSK